MARDFQTLGPLAPPSGLLTTSACRQLYYQLNDLEEEGGWGSAGKAANLGKMEYHVPRAACLVALSGHRAGALPDNAIKCAMRHFDLRVVRDCTMVDTEVMTSIASNPLSSKWEPRSLPSRLLSSCPKDPITMTDVGKCISSLSGAAFQDERTKLLQSLADMGLGEVRPGRRLPNSSDGRSLEFHRFPLTDRSAQTLCKLSVPARTWPAAVQNEDLPPMQGAGSQSHMASVCECRAVFVFVLSPIRSKNLASV